jgi:hypothetical protein
MESNVDVCKHEWNFKIVNMTDSNIFIEQCTKCDKNINTFELFKD